MYEFVNKLMYMHIMKCLAHFKSTVIVCAYITYTRRKFVEIPTLENHKKIIKKKLMGSYLRG